MLGSYLSRLIIQKTFQQLGFWTILVTSSLLFSSATFASDKTQILFLLKTNEIEKAFTLYQKNYTDKPDFKLLEEMATLLLKEGILSSDPETQLLTMYGASIAKLLCPLHILEEGLESDNPYVQAASIRTLAEMGEDGTDEILMKAMHSSFLMIRIQAAHVLAMRGHKKVLGPIESLMRKLPIQAWVFFPEFYAQIGNSQAISILKSLLHSPVTEVRLSSIYYAAKHNRDDLLPLIRSMATHVDLGEQEMAAFALGAFKDAGSKELLLKLQEAKEPEVALAASFALTQIGESKAEEKIIELAKKKNPFAISLLARYEKGRDTLAELLHDKEPSIRLNALISLIKHKDPRSLSALGEFLFHTHQDLGFMPVSSMGHALRAFRIIPLATAKAKQDQGELLAITQALREELLTDSLEFEEPLFLLIARKLFETKQLALVPLLVHLLENRHSDATISLLQEMATHSRVPLIRAYCNLALYRLEATGFDEKALYSWVEREKESHLIQFRTKASSKKKNKLTSIYALTPEETSNLLIESYQALAIRHDPKAVEILVNAIAHGNPKNRYALAGLLLLAIQ